MPPELDIIALDADDTLWHNEPVFQAVQARFRELLAPYHDGEWIERRLIETEKRNLEHFGYGVKGFTLSMVETAVELTEGRISGSDIQRIVDWGREMLQHPVELLDGAAEAVRELAERHRLMLVTKGDPYDQESKLARSGLGDYFSAVEIVTEKDARCYRMLTAHYGVEPRRFLMAGNSLRSDVLPVLEIGGVGVHIPYPLTCSFELVDEEDLRGRQFVRLESIRELPALLDTPRTYA